MKQQVKIAAAIGVVALISIAGISMMRHAPSTPDAKAPVEKVTDKKDYVKKGRDMPALRTDLPKEVDAGTSKQGHPLQKVTVLSRTGKPVELTLEVVEKPVDLQIGLMFRDKLEKKTGMMFLLGHEPQMISFWMKNTIIPLDMLFIDKDGMIVSVHHNAKPESLTPIPSVKPVVAVIEIAGTEADRLTIGIGSQVSHSYFTAGK